MSGTSLMSGLMSARIPLKQRVLTLLTSLTTDSGLLQKAGPRPRSKTGASADSSSRACPRGSHARKCWEGGTGEHKPRRDGRKGTRRHDLAPLLPERHRRRERALAGVGETLQRPQARREPPRLARVPPRPSRAPEEHRRPADSLPRGRGGKTVRGANL